MSTLLGPLMVVAAGVLWALLEAASTLFPLVYVLRHNDIGPIILVIVGSVWAFLCYSAKPQADGAANSLNHPGHQWGQLRQSGQWGHSGRLGHWGRWLLWIGIGSQLLPALRIAEPFRYLFAGKQAIAGFLISVLGGFLCGFDKAKTQAVGGAPPAERHAGSSASPALSGTASGPAQPSATSSSTLKQPASSLHGITHFNVVLIDAGPRKIDVIEEVHKLIGKQLAEVFDLVNAAPVCIKDDLPEKEARAMLVRLRALGATVELR